MYKALTEKTRFRPHAAGNTVLLVLQVEERHGNTPISSWRDARIEDVTDSESVVSFAGLAA